jgi:hypothetical protein
MGLMAHSSQFYLLSEEIVQNKKKKVFLSVVAFLQILTFYSYPQSIYITRVPQCLSPRPKLGPPASECPPPRNQGGGGERTRLRGGEVPIQITGEKAKHTVYSVLVPNTYAVVLASCHFITMMHPPPTHIFYLVYLRCK